MNKIILVTLLLLSTNALSVELPWQSSIPAYLMDSSGFINPFAPVHTSQSKNYFLTPLRKGRSKFYGFKISNFDESRYLDIREVQQYLRQFVIPITNDSYSLYNFNGSTYAISAEYAADIKTVSTVKSTCFGLCFSFASDTISLGDITTYGINFNFGFNGADLTESYGINFAESLQDLQLNIEDMFEGINSPEQLVISSELLSIYSGIKSTQTGSFHYMSTIKTALLNNENKYGESKQLLTSIRKGDFSLDEQTSIPTEMALLKSDRSEKLNTIMESLENNLEQEMVWRKKIPTGHTQIVHDQGVNRFVQDLCDRAANLYHIPEEIWPECRVATSLVPNAWAYPGGKIFFTAGIIGVMKNFESFMQVIGHELGHVVSRHTTKREPIVKTLSLGINALAIAQTIWALQGGNKPFSKIPLIEKLFDNWYFNANASAIGSGLLFEPLLLIPLAGLMMYARSDETQADALGQEIAYAGGADHNKMAKGWDDFKDYAQKVGRGNQTFFEKLMRSHPIEEDRIAGIHHRKVKLPQSLDEYHKKNKLDQKYYDQYEYYHKLYSKSVDWHITEIHKKDGNQKKYYEENLLRSHGNCIKHLFSNFK